MRVSRTLRIRIPSSSSLTTQCCRRTSLKQYQWTTSRRSSTASASSKPWTSRSWSRRARPFRMCGTCCTGPSGIMLVRYLRSHSSTSCASWWIWTTWWSCQIARPTTGTASWATPTIWTRSLIWARMSTPMGIMSMTSFTWFQGAKLKA